MANGTLNGDAALLLQELLSASLLAMIQANALAARATVDFLEDVGFTTEKEGQALTLGMAQFRFRKAHANGELAKFEAAVSLVVARPSSLASNWNGACAAGGKNCARIHRIQGAI